MISRCKVEAGPIAVALFAMIGAACSSGGNGQQASPSAVAYAPTIDPASFTDQITNPFFPLTPGTTFVYEGTADGEPEHNETTVTGDTKVILGVTCVVVHDIVTKPDGEIVEDTYDWYAQDAAGNVWYFGEDTKEYESGEVVSTTGSWEAGVDGAQPGIVMEASPVVGDEYRQEYYAGEAEDMARVLSTSESRTVPYGSFENVLLTEDFTRLDAGVIEHKYYAKGVGFVYSEIVEGGSEVTQLVEVRTG